jgi:hypothetical protein
MSDRKNLTTRARAQSSSTIASGAFPEINLNSEI